MIIAAMSVTEISIATIAVAFVVLVIFLVIASVKLRRSVEVAQQDLHRVSLEVSSFISKATELSTDIQHKAESLLESLTSLKAPSSDGPEETISHQLMKPLKLIGWLVSGFSLAKKTSKMIQKLW